MTNDLARGLSFMVAGPPNAFPVVVTPSLSSLSPSLSTPTTSTLSPSLLSLETLVAGSTRAPTSDTTVYSPYIHGLAGVNQPLNYFCINMLVIIFAVIALVALIYRVATAINAHLHYLRAAGSDASTQACLKHNQTSFIPWLKRHMLLAPLFTTRHNREMTFTLRNGHILNFGTFPLRLQTVLLIAYIASNIAYCCILDYSQPRKAMLAELRGRSGALAAFNLVPTVLFALRNNPLIHVLKISYDTFNLFHRWCARTVIFMSVLHVGAWGTNTVDQGGSAMVGKLITSYASLSWATLAMATMLLIAVQSWSPVRRAAYETFIAGHRLLVFLAIIGVYVHLDKDNLPQLPYVWTVMFLWIAEWFFRSMRMIFRNYGHGEKTEVLVEALTGGACRVTFHVARPWTYKPGSHVYISLPHVQWFAMHPFSVAWSSEGQQQSPFDDEESFISIDLEKDVETTTKELGRAQISRRSVFLVVRARNGMTRKLFDLATKSGKNGLRMAGYIDGPYHGHDNIDAYGTVLLFAAGVGITHQLGFVRHLIQGHDEKTVAAQKIVLVWSVPDMECLSWVQPWLDEILHMPAYRDVLQIKIFVTRTASPLNLSSGQGTVAISSGRCDAQKVVDEVFASRVGAMVMTVCGPGAFADSVRSAARSKVELGSVDFVEEGFSY